MHISSPIPLTYTLTSEIATYDCDKNRQLRPSALLRMQQEIGELHLREGSLGYDVLCERSFVFLLTKCACRIHRLPLLGEPVRMTTWHRDSRGAQSYRCYKLETQSGEPLANSISAFALLDIASRKLLRPSAAAGLGVPSSSNIVDCPDPDKIIPPAPLADTGIWQARWSHTDWNGHVNNTVYADLLCDFLPAARQNAPITSFSIVFQREACEGDTLRMLYGEDAGSGYIRGEQVDGEQACFTARVDFG